MLFAVAAVAAAAAAAAIQDQSTVSGESSRVRL